MSQESTHESNKEETGLQQRSVWDSFWGRQPKEVENVKDKTDDSNEFKD